MKKNEFIQLTITDMNDLGYGVSHIDGKVVFVKNAVTDDIVKAKIIKDGGRYYVALIEEVIERSEKRADSGCTHFPKCGGCSFCHISYDYEKELKRGFVKAFLQKEGLGDLAVLPVLSTGQTSGYRNKVQFPYKGGKLGYYAGYSHRVVTDEKCFLHHPAMQPLLTDLSAFLRDKKVEDYDEETGKGLLRHVFLRCDCAGKNILLTLVLNDEKFPYEEELLALTARHSEVKGLFYNVNTEKTNVILGEKYIKVRGEETLTDTLLGCTFDFAPASFYQVNHDACALLYKEAIDRAGLSGGEIVADLFCGVGTIGICALMRTPEAKLVGVEVIPAAVENARKNASRNGIKNAKFVCGDANHPVMESADVVFVDPPRKGLDEALVEHLSKLKKLRKIVYVSCNPATLARDLARFRARGWDIGELQPVDMFPKTGHIETVVLLSHKKEKNR